MIRQGFPDLLGATPDSAGTNFAIYSGAAESVDLCLFDEHGRETVRYALPDCSNGIWHGYLPQCRPGQQYGYRVHGAYDPAAGLRFNASKLLLDPYARQLHGELIWSAAVFDFEPDQPADIRRINKSDSAPFVPRSVVVSDSPFPAKRTAPRVPWADTILYEANVRGYTMLHPAVPAADRGTFRGMRNGEILAYLKALGITSVELLPVQAFVDEQFLVQRGLRNLWGYNTIGFFAPANRYLAGDTVSAFRDMVDAIHEAGMEVILDVAFNHTGESDENGPSLCFRGIDNRCYYRAQPDNAGVYINDTGCGNTLNVDHPAVQRLVLDSLRYWHRNMGVDGFRFDLATVLGRGASGFAKSHPLLLAISSDPGLHSVKLIAEPWDPGPGGYQLGGFPPAWAEWNDRYRDSARRFWRGDPGAGGELARRMHGSADFFEASGRLPSASINFISSHDGFTLADTVSYAHRHNEANGEGNRDGHELNFSSNHGIEGATADPVIVADRRRLRLNLLATLLLSQGTPMLLAGDEFGNSQLGNNNAYAQDNATGWLDWSGLEQDPEFNLAVRQLIELRRSTSLLRRNTWLHGLTQNSAGWCDIEWCRPDGSAMQAADWQSGGAFSLLLTGTPPHTAAANAAMDMLAAPGDSSLAILVNGSPASIEFRLRAPAPPGAWQLAFSSQADPMAKRVGNDWLLLPFALALLRLPHE